MNHLTSSKTNVPASWHGRRISRGARFKGVRSKMQIIGFKGCPNCGKNLNFIDSLVQAFINKEHCCISCEKTFRYEGFRNKLAWVLLLLIIFLPTVLILKIPETFLNSPLLTHYPVKYFLAVIIFYIVCGNNKYLPNKDKQNGTS